MGSNALKAYISRLPRTGSGELVTIVRYRYVIEEKVISREEFEKINKPDTGDGWPDYVFEEAGDEGFVDWQSGYEPDFMPEVNPGYKFGFLVFDGDVRGNSDDYVSMKAGVNNWESQFPLTIH